MKKLFLLFASGSIAFSVSAQQRTLNMVHTSKDEPVDYASHKKFVNATLQHKNEGAAHKTTATSRWYDYVDYFDQNETALSSSIAVSSPYLWGDNLVKHAFSDGSGGTIFDTANLVSMGLVTDPAFSGFNNYTYYPGEQMITATDAYTVDSIRFFGAYIVNPAKIAAAPVGGVDTIRVSIVHGSGAAGSDIFETNTTINAGSILTNYGPVGSTLKNQRMNLNGAKLCASGTTVVVKDILLDNRTSPPTWTLDTNVNGTYVGKVALSPAINVSAGEMVGVTVSFISGYHATTPSIPLYDTVFRGNPYVPFTKWNMLRPVVAHRGTSTSISFPTYSATDRNTGSFVDSSNAGIYVPHWFWSSGSSAASVQYPEIQIHTNCASCGVTVPTSSVASINNIVTTKAYPNPAANELNVTFGLSTAANVTVTLSNTLGQVVATQNMGKVSGGKAIFNTASLSGGVYVYNILADGQRNTGRVVVAH